MKRHFLSVFTACLALAMVAGPMPVATAGQSVEVRLKDGSKWRGEVDDIVEVGYYQQRIEVSLTGRITRAADLYIVVEGDIAGMIRQKTIFRDDVITMRTVTGEAADTSARRASGRSARRDADTKEAGPESRKLGVFVLPLDGSVGEAFRHEEIKKIGEKADEYGPGQIIVLLINTNGGSVLESQDIAETIFDIRERHRVVAWIQKAISAGCQTAMCCHEIYFMTEGTAGAVTTWDGVGNSIKGDDLEAAMDHLVDIAKRSGHSEHIARAMKTNKAMCSYDKDPATGEVTFYGDLSGRYVLSDANSNLSFTSSTALHCGFSKGTADTEEELARQLDLPQWYEKSNYGREIAERWQETVKRAHEEIPRLNAQLGYLSTSGDQTERIGTVITIYQKFLRWHDRCPNVAEQMLQRPEYYEREIAELRKQLADMRRR